MLYFDQINVITEILHLRMIWLERTLEILLIRVANVYVIFSRGLAICMGYQIQSSQQPTEMVKWAPLLQMRLLMQKKKRSNLFKVS